MRAKGINLPRHETRIIDFVIRGRKMVVPEERHLFFERAARLRHTENPPVPNAVQRIEINKIFADGLQQNFEVVGDSFGMQQAAAWSPARPEAGILLPLVRARPNPARRKRCASWERSSSESAIC